MAEDKLIFPVGFDLDSAVKKAESEWISKYQAQLSKAIEGKPLSVKVGFDAKQLDNIEDVQKRLSQIKLMPVTDETKGAIQSLVKELKNLEKILKRIDKLNAANAKGNASANAANELAAQSSPHSRNTGSNSSESATGRG